MTAINLMLPDGRSTDQKNGELVFLVAMDREKIATGLAVQYEELLPYLYPEVDDLADGQHIEGAAPHAGLQYGYTFVEKFIHVPFQLPAPQVEDIGRLLHSMANRESRFPSPQPPSARMEVRTQITTGDDSEVVHDLATLISPAFDNNPRRIKQFVNLFRLRAYIGEHTPLFRDEDTPEGKREAVTLEQLGKFVALSIRWPRLVAELEREPRLLQDLENFALNYERESSAEDWERAQEITEDRNRLLGRRKYKAWMRDENLRLLLRTGIADDGSKVRGVEGRRRYSFANVDIKKLLRVSPPMGQFPDQC